MAELENRVSNIETKLDMFIEEMRDLKKEIRQQNEMRAAEIREMSKKHDADMKEMRQNHEADMKEMRQNHEADMKEMRQKQEADMKEIRNSLDGMGKHVRNISIAAIVGIGAISASVIGFFITTLLK